jgi:hypothetical protein
LQRPFNGYLLLAWHDTTPHRIRRAIDHVMARGNARQDIVQDDKDRRRLLEDLERAVVRAGWEVLALVVLSADAF